MTRPETLYVQRIQPGLPLEAESKEGRLLLRLAGEETPEDPWAVIPLSESRKRDEEYSYDVTLEAFRNGKRLNAETIRETGFGDLSREPGTVLRLVINHGRNGDPLRDPDWRSENLPILRRPTLLPEADPVTRFLFERLPCETVRRLRRVSPEKWNIEDRLPGLKGVRDEEDGTVPVRSDRYVRMSRRLSTHPTARPFSPPSVPNAGRGDPFRPFRMAAAADPRRAADRRKEIQKKPTSQPGRIKEE